MLDVRDTIRARGASVFYLPPYSPDLNSIEHAFAKLKTLFRTAARRTVDALWNAIGHAHDGMRQLPRPRWLCSHQTGKRSSATLGDGLSQLSGQKRLMRNVPRTATMSDSGKPRRQ